MNLSAGECIFPRIMKISATAIAMVLLASMPGGVALAANIDEKKLDSLLKQIEEQRKQINEQQKKLDEQQAAIEMQMQEFSGMKADIKEMNLRGAGKPGDAAPVAEKPKEIKETEQVGTERKPESKEKPPAVVVLADQGGVLLKKGKAVLEPSVEYSNSSAVRVAIQGFTIIPALNIGAFEVSEVSRDTAVAAVTGRYGITNRIEIDAKVPYVYRNDTIKARPFGTGSAAETTQEVSGDGIGDVELGAHYQINNGEGGWPFFIGNMRFKSATGKGPFDVPINGATGLQLELPTGSGFYAFQPSVTAIYPSDPVVFFSNVGYLYNVGKNEGARGKIDPGDSISGSFGMGLSLNDKASFSIGYSHDTVFETTQNSRKLNNSRVLQIGSLNMSYAYKLTEATNLNFSVSAGLTEDSPDVRLLFSVPMTFDSGL